jgi:hypothetical protein
VVDPLPEVLKHVDDLCMPTVEVVAIAATFTMRVRLARYNEAFIQPMIIVADPQDRPAISPNHRRIRETPMTTWMFSTFVWCESEVLSANEYGCGESRLKEGNPNISHRVLFRPDSIAQQRPYHLRIPNDTIGVRRRRSIIVEKLDCPRQCMGIGDLEVVDGETSKAKKRRSGESHVEWIGVLRAGTLRQILWGRQT